jgi:predicted acetyltransferase
LLSFLFRRFHFYDTGPLVDGELELVPPQLRWADEVLQSCRHPLTVCDAPSEARLTRSQLEHFLSAAPLGHEPADSSRDKAPTYHFWMMLRHGSSGPAQPPPLRIAGGVGLRIGSGESLEMYYGHFGYHVYPAARGHHYAERACRLLLPLAQRHRLRTVWITCNPDNMASRRTCERLGAQFVNIVSVPPEDPLFARGETEKCRYRIDL